MFFSSAGVLKIFVLFSVLVISAQAQTTAPQKPTEDVIRVTTTLVTVPVSVKDRHGKSISNLRREDFRLYEDGVEQEIVYFDSPAAHDGASGSNLSPLTIALLLDTSDSTQFKLKQIQATAMAFVDQLGANDRMLIIAFDKQVRALTEATNDRSTLRAAINRTITGGGTSLYDAVDEAINHHLNRISGRKAIVLLTDGVDTSSSHGTYLGTVRAAHQLDAAIYPVQYHTYGDFADNSSRETYGLGNLGATAHMTKTGEPASEAYKRATLYLRLLADQTGGRFQYVDNLKNLRNSFARIASELNEQYTLGYYPKNNAGKAETLRQIRVEIALPGMKVHARRSYLSKPSQ